MASRWAGTQAPKVVEARSNHSAPASRGTSNRSATRRRGRGGKGSSPGQKRNVPARPRSTAPTSNTPQQMQPHVGDAAKRLVTAAIRQQAPRQQISPGKNLNTLSTNQQLPTPPSPDQTPTSSASKDTRLTTTEGQMAVQSREEMNTEMNPSPQGPGNAVASSNKPDTALYAAPGEHSISMSANATAAPDRDAREQTLVGVSKSNESQENPAPGTETKGFENHRGRGRRNNRFKEYARAKAIKESEEGAAKKRAAAELAAKPRVKLPAGPSNAMPPATVAEPEPRMASMQGSTSRTSPVQERVASTTIERPLAALQIENQQVQTPTGSTSDVAPVQTSVGKNITESPIGYITYEDGSPAGHLTLEAKEIPAFVPSPNAKGKGPAVYPEDGVARDPATPNGAGPSESA